MSPALFRAMEEPCSAAEERALAALVVALALTHEALTVDYPDEPDPLCPRRYAADIVLYHLAALGGALTRYQAVLDGDHRLPFHVY